MAKKQASEFIHEQSADQDTYSALDAEEQALLRRLEEVQNRKAEFGEWIEKRKIIFDLRNALNALDLPESRNSKDKLEDEVGLAMSEIDAAFNSLFPKQESSARNGRKPSTGGGERQTRTKITDPSYIDMQKSNIEAEYARQAALHLGFGKGRRTPEQQRQIEAEVKKVRNSGWENERISKFRAAIRKAEQAQRN